VADEDQIRIFVDDCGQGCFFKPQIDHFYSFYNILYCGGLHIQDRSEAESLRFSVRVCMDIDTKRFCISLLTLPASFLWWALDIT
jgi:hypothetical protein